MDASVSAALTTGLTDFSGGIMDVIVAVIPLAVVLLIAVAGVRFGVKFFKGLARVR